MMEGSMRVTFSNQNFMVVVFFLGLMEKYIKDSGEMVKGMVKVP